MTPRVVIGDLSVGYGAETALRGVSLDIGVGERLAAIGESGSGKTTLGLAIADLLPPSAQLSGRIEWPNFSRMPVGGRDIGLVFQDPSASLDPVMSIGRQIAEVVKSHTRSGWSDSLAYAHLLLKRVQLDPARLLDAYPHQLSGGQQQRVAIACAIAAGPALLIADEATSALDTIVQAEIMELIDRLVSEDRMSLLFISHDIALASQIADRIAVFRNGELVEIGETARMVDSPGHPYTKSLLDAHIGLDAGSRLPAFAERDGRP